MKPSFVRLAAVLFLVLAVGCSSGESGLRKLFPTPESAPPPADTPAHLIARLRWACEQRDSSMLRELFTDDCDFAVAPVDSDGVGHLACAEELGRLCGVGECGGSLTLSPEEARTESDLRPGKTEPWHQRVTLYVKSRVRRCDGTVVESEWDAIFYVVQADSALILPPRSPRPLPWWYVERFENLSGQLGGP